MELLKAQKNLKVLTIIYLQVNPNLNIDFTSRSSIPTMRNTNSNGHSQIPMMTGFRNSKKRAEVWRAESLAIAIKWRTRGQPSYNIYCGAPKEILELSQSEFICVEKGYGIPKI